MKTLIKIIIPTLALFGVPAQSQVVLQTFSAVRDLDLNFFYGTWEATGTGASVNPNAQFVQGPGVYDITGSTIVPTNDADSKMRFFNASPLSIGSNTFLSVTAQALTGNVATSFTVFLVDTSGFTAYAAFGAFDFVTGSYTTLTGSLTFQSGFHPSSVDSMIISGNQPGGTAPFNVSFDNVAAVSAIPEPATSAALAGIFTLGFVFWRRRRALRTSC
jgi:hypothetical protein